MHDRTAMALMRVLVRTAALRQRTHLSAADANSIGSTIEGSSRTGLLTLVEIGHVRIRNPRAAGPTRETFTFPAASPAISGSSAPLCQESDHRLSRGFLGSVTLDVVVLDDLEPALLLALLVGGEVRGRAAQDLHVELLGELPGDVGR